MNSGEFPSNLWPTLEEIGSANFTAPVVIMRQQAEGISLITKNILEGQVITEKVRNLVPPTPKNERVLPAALTGVGSLRDKDNEPKYVVDDEKVRYAFFLRASALDGAKIRLFDVTHDIAPAYPAIFSIKFSEIDKNNTRVENEDLFRGILQEFFHSQKVKKILQSLIGQSIGPDVDLSVSE